MINSSSVLIILDLKTINLCLIYYFLLIMRYLLSTCTFSFLTPSLTYIFLITLIYPQHQINQIIYHLAIPLTLNPFLFLYHHLKLINKDSIMIDFIILIIKY